MPLSALTQPLTALTEAAVKTLSVSRVYGEPITAGETTIVPVATVVGSHGIAAGEGREGEPPEASGAAGGFGVLGWPAGAYVVENGRTSWRPALDANLVVLGVAAVGVSVVAAIGSVALARTFTGGTAHLADTAAQTATTLGGQAAGAFGAAVDATSSTVGTAIEAAAGSTATLATATSSAFASAAGSAAGAFGSFARRATDAALDGTKIASAALLGLGGIGAKAFGETIGATERTLLGTLGKRR